MAKTKIMVFTEGTLIMHPGAKGHSGGLPVFRLFNYSLSVRDYKNYIPIGNCVEKLKKWVKQGAEIVYLTSRRKPKEIKMIQGILDKYEFPKGKLLHREGDENYNDVAERVIPDILIEDDCESIGGEKEMTITFVKPEIKRKIKSICVKEFGGIDHLPDDFHKL